MHASGSSESFVTADDVQTNTDEERHQEQGISVELDTINKSLTQQSVDAIYQDKPFHSLQQWLISSRHATPRTSQQSIAADYDDMPFHSLQQFLMSLRHDTPRTATQLVDSKVLGGESLTGMLKIYKLSAVEMTNLAENRKELKQLLKMPLVRQFSELGRTRPRTDFDLVRSIYEAVGIDKATLKPSALSSNTDDKQNPAEKGQLRPKKASRDLASARKMSDGSFKFNTSSNSINQSPESGSQKSSEHVSDRGLPSGHSDRSGAVIGFKSHSSPKLYGFLGQSHRMS